MKVLTGNWESLKEQAAPIRQIVFVQEQKVPKELEYDDQDHLCLHVVVLDDTEHAVGTGRLLPDGHIGRVAVLSDCRGQGVGGRIMSALMDEARRKGHEEVVIHAQISAEPFYMTLGFEPEGDVFMEADIPHRVMRKVLINV